MMSKTILISQFNALVSDLGIRLEKLLEGAGGEIAVLLKQIISKLESETKRNTEMQTQAET